MSSTANVTSAPVAGTLSGTAILFTSITGAGNAGAPAGMNCTSAVASAVTADPSSAVPEAVTVSGKYAVSMGIASPVSGTVPVKVHSMVAPFGGSTSASGLVTATSPQSSPRSTTLPW